MPGYDDQLLAEIGLLGELVELASTAQTLGPSEVDGALGVSTAAETERGAPFSDRGEPRAGTDAGQREGGARAMAADVGEYAPLVGRRLRDARQGRGLTVEEVEDRSDGRIPAAAVRGYEAVEHGRERCWRCCARHSS